MQLKRRLVGLREPARGPGGTRKPPGFAVTSGALVSALHFREEPANGGCLRLGGRLGEVALRLRGDRTAQARGSPGATEESVCGPSHAAARADFGRLRPHVGAAPARVHCVQCPGTAEFSRSWWHDNSRRGRWRPNGCIRPVLKHGPRSATCARVFGWQTPRRSESVSGLVPPWREPWTSGSGAHRRPIPFHAVVGFE